MISEQGASRPRSVGIGGIAGWRPLNRFGLVLVLIVVDYIAVSTITITSRGSVATTFLLSATLLFALRASEVRRLWILLALFYVVASTLLAFIILLWHGTIGVSQNLTVIGGLLLIGTPFAIGKHVSSQRIVDTDSVLGALCVYLLLGFSFAFIYSAIGHAQTLPFFSGRAHATINNFLFFSYSTLTTVGYGDLVPASALGQTFAMLEALAGQIYLVIVVARLVSLWGQARPPKDPSIGRHAEPDHT